MWKSTGRAPSLRVFTLAFALQLWKKHGKTCQSKKNFIQVKKNLCQSKKNFSQVKKNLSQEYSID